MSEYRVEFHVSGNCYIVAEFESDAADRETVRAQAAEIIHAHAPQYSEDELLALGYCVEKMGHGTPVWEGGPACEIIEQPERSRPQPLLEWLQDRHENCLRLAAQKSGRDRDGWLEDAEYFEQAINALRDELEGQATQ